MNNTENLTTLYRAIRIGRAKNRCEHCGVANGAYEWPNGKLTKIALIIFHLDLDRKNNAESNLACLCQDCMAKAEISEQERRDKAQGGSVQERLL